MSVRFTDAEIEALIAERKSLPADFRTRLAMRPKRGHDEAEIAVVGAEGNEFRIVVRQGRFNPLDFSVILSHCPPHTNQAFRLRRYNGKSHQHTNKIENEKFYDFHIHYATERYQLHGDGKEDGYARPTDRYGTAAEALECLIADCAFFVLPAEPPTDSKESQQ